MKRAVPVVLLVLLLAGCEEQEAVPLSRSLPVALLQLVAVGVAVVGGYALLERSARRHDPAVGDERGTLAILGALVFGSVGAAVTGLLAWWAVSLPGAYESATTSVFSWADSVRLLWLLMVPGLPFALFELRVAAACWFQRRWARWGAGVQVAGAALWLAWANLA